MARYLTDGFEGSPTTAGACFLEFEGHAQKTNNGDITRDTGTVRSGSSSWKITNGAASRGNAWVQINHGYLGSTVGSYCRCYFYFDNLPSVTSEIMWSAADAGATKLVSARLTSGGKLQLYNNVGAAQVGSDSTETITTGQWYKITLYTKLGTGAVDEAELQLDDVSVASSTSLSLSDGQIYHHCIGLNNGSSNSDDRVFYIDDLVVNTTSGATNNSWPGDSKILYLAPISDNSIGNWTGGAGGTSNLYDAVNNLPPVGVVDASATNTSQIENATTSASDFDVNMQSYTTAGIVATDTINLVHPKVANGTYSGTNLPGRVQIVSNPAGSSEAITISGRSALGTFGTNWAAQALVNALVESPSVTLGTSPVLRVGRTDATASTAVVCAMFIAVDYTPAPQTPPYINVTIS